MVGEGSGTGRKILGGVSPFGVRGQVDRGRKTPRRQDTDCERIDNILELDPASLLMLQNLFSAPALGLYPPFGHPQGDGRTHKDVHTTPSRVRHPLPRSRVRRWSELGVYTPGSCSLLYLWVNDGVGEGRRNRGKT